MVSYSGKDYPHSQLTNKIIGLAIKVHKTIGPGFREKYYQRAMYLELQNSKLKFNREVKIGIPYGRVNLGFHILDFVIDNKIVLELKSMKKVTSVEIGQLTTYLRLANCKVGLLLNFGQPTLEIKRIKV